MSLRRKTFTRLYSDCSKNVKSKEKGVYVDKKSNKSCLKMTISPSFPFTWPVIRLICYQEKGEETKHSPQMIFGISEMDVFEVKGNGKG